MFHIKHRSSSSQSLLADGNLGNEFLEMTKPCEGEPIIKKNVNSAFIGTDLKQRLDGMGNC